MKLTNQQRLQVAAALVRKERAEDGILVSVRGVTVNKLHSCASKLAASYRSTQNFASCLQDIVEEAFPNNEDAQTVAKRVLGHYFSWRRHGQMSDKALRMARTMKLILI